MEPRQRCSQSEFCVVVPSIQRRVEDARFKEQRRRDEQTCHGTGVKGKFRILILFPGHWLEHSSPATVCERVEERELRLWHIVAYRAEVRSRAMRLGTLHQATQGFWIDDSIIIKHPYPVCIEL